jgi:hypothetical protein
MCALFGSVERGLLSIDGDVRAIKCRERKDMAVLAGANIVAIVELYVGATKRTGSSSSLLNDDAVVVGDVVLSYSSLSPVLTSKTTNLGAWANRDRPCRNSSLAGCHMQA